MSQQLPLPLTAPERGTFQRFVTGANGELIARLRRANAGFDCLWLFGAGGVGKTHLLQALCHHQPRASYIPATEMGASDASLGGYARFDVVGIDDVPRWLGQRGPELALIDLYNQLAGRGGRLVLTADRSPRDVAFALPDLGSRLRAAACYRVAALADEDKPGLLAAAARRRGLCLAADVIQFLLTHANRDQRELLRVLDLLDGLSLVEQRRITVPFVKRALCL